jgi:hypothetical protein
MSERLRLAQACEAASEPDRDVELEIWRLDGGTCPAGKVPLPWLHCFMSSVDAAMALCHPGDELNVMSQALSRMGTRLPRRPDSRLTGVSYRQRLARFVTAAALRATDARERSETGRGLDLAYYDLPDAFLRMGNTYRTADAGTVAAAGLDERPLARAWDAIADMLVKERVTTRHPGPATSEMLAAGQAAYDRKNDDAWSTSPTEHPEDGGGPLGYAWRAMVGAMPRA